LVIELQGLTKEYRAPLRARTVPALQDLTLSIPRGEVLGIAGPNGAGKSTLISLLLGFLNPTRGTVRIDGTPPRPYVERHGVGYLAELVVIPPKWTVETALRRHATLANVSAAGVSARVDEAIDQLGLGEHRTKRTRELSKGNLQRLGLAHALLGDNDLVVLDEPTHGLDPVWTQRFRDIVRELRRPSRAILIASHNLDELERLADRVMILHQGRLQRVVSAGEVGPAAARIYYRVGLAAPHPALAQVFPDAVPVEGRQNEWRIHTELSTLNRGLAELLGAGATLASFSPEESRLESEFRVAMGGGR
jgi:ABC-2 type transport system ATP-binding protein